MAPQSSKNNLPNKSTTSERIQLTPVGRVNVEAVFDEPELISDGGALMIREAAKTNGIVKAFADAITDNRSQAHVDHSYHDLIMQRVTQIALGYEDANDCNFMRKDWAVKMATDKLAPDDGLGSQPTMSRFENSVTRRDLFRLFYALIDNWLDSYSSPPEQLVLDVDPTACHTYGQQELALYNTHYGGHCLMPFHVYEGLSGKVIATVIRPGKTPTKEEIIALMKRIVRRIRDRFPNVTLIFRADSHHCKPAVLDWLEANDVRYVVGLATNAVLQRNVGHLVDQVKVLYEQGMKTCRRLHSFEYAAESWGDSKRRVIARVQGSCLGVDARFIVTDLRGASAKFLYETVYCDRGSAELMIKEHKCFLHSDRTSCTSALANQFRLMLHSAAYVILHGIRQSVLSGTEFARATFRTIRLRLLKIAARVEVAKTFVRFHLPATVSAAVAAVYARCATLGAACRGT